MKGLASCYWDASLQLALVKLQKVDRITREEQYLNLKSSARKLKLGRKWIFQQDKRSQAYGTRGQKVASRQPSTN